MDTGKRPIQILAITVLIIVLFFSAYFIYKENAGFFGNVEEDLKSCVPRFEHANYTMYQELREGNNSRRFLKSPKHYWDVSARCAEALECVSAKGYDINHVSLVDKYPGCQFFVFYYGSFAKCADILIGKRNSGLACIDVLFNDSFEENAEMCKLWDGAQECFRRQILNSCDVVPGETRKRLDEKDHYYAEKIGDLRQVYCPAN